MTQKKRDCLLLLCTALFLIAAAVQSALYALPGDSTFVLTEISAPDVLSTPAVSAAGGLININTANEEELCRLPGIGPVLAGRIIAWRQENGPFTAPGDLIMVSGIGDKIYAGLEGLITCEEDSE